MFKFIITFFVMGFFITNIAYAQPAPWNSVEQEMQYRDERTIWRPETLPNNLPPAAVLQANKMWCKEIQFKFENDITRRFGFLWDNTVERNERGFIFSSSLSELYQKYHYWRERHIEKVWLALLSDTKLDYRSCAKEAKRLLQDVDNFILSFLQQYEQPYKR